MPPLFLADPHLLGALGHEAAALLLSAPPWRELCQPSPHPRWREVPVFRRLPPTTFWFSAPTFRCLGSLIGSPWLCVDFILLMTRGQAVVLKPSLSKSVPRPAPSASPENLLEVQLLRPTSGLLNRKLWWWGGAQQLVSEQALQGLLGDSNMWEPLSTALLLQSEKV